MDAVAPVEHFDFKEFDTLILAGGGNRCIWQSGLITTLMAAGYPLPPTINATSAGAGVAAGIMAGEVAASMAATRRLYANNPKVWRMTARGPVFAHRHIYPAWVESYVNENTWPRLLAHPSKLRVAVTLPSRLGSRVSALAGTSFYLFDKYVSRNIHPKVPGFLGLTQAFVVLQECQSLAEAQTLLVASGSAPPFTPARVIQGQKMMDGGYVDNAAIDPTIENDPSRTLVLLTRHYPKLPRYFRYQGRLYWQASKKIPVSTWDCTPNTDIDAPFALGVADAQHYLTIISKNETF